VAASEISGTALYPVKPGTGLEKSGRFGTNHRLAGFHVKEVIIGYSADVFRGFLYRCWDVPRLSLLPFPGRTQQTMILYNGKIITVDSLDNIFSAVAIREGKIIRLGSDKGIRKLAGPGCRLINLDGKAATSGLVDSHYHVMYYGQQFIHGENNHP